MPSEQFPKNPIEKQKKEVKDSTKEDSKMLEKIKDFKSDPKYLENLSLEDFKSYKEKAEKFNEFFISSRKEINDPLRYEFWATLTQKWTSVWLNIQTEEYKRKKKYKKT